jgi:mRNA-degrading endonuclease toxin of MazEF toxin-antitoxin module
VLVDWRGNRLPNEPGGLRPAVVVEDTALMAENYPNVLVVPMTTDERYATYAAFVERISPTPDNGAPDPCYAIAHHVTSVSIQRIRATTATITAEQLESIRRRILVAIGGKTVT